MSVLVLINKLFQNHVNFHSTHIIVERFSSDEYEYVPKVVEAILSMPEGAHVGVRRTCIHLLGELCEWIEQHGACLAPALDCLIKALHDERLAPTAAGALQVGLLVFRHTAWRNSLPPVFVCA